MKNKATNEIKKEIYAVFPGLASYFDTIFPWLERTSVQWLFTNQALQKNTSTQNIIYSYLFGQITAQIRDGLDERYPSKKLFPAWDYLLDKLVEKKHFTKEHAAKLRDDMEGFRKLAEIGL